MGNNADYVVDALSRRLRRLEDFPDGPQFIKAVLGDARSDAARVLLPFLKDPILRVAEHLGIGNRDTSNVNSNGGSFGDKTGTADGSTADAAVTVFLLSLFHICRCHPTARSSASCRACLSQQRATTYTPTAP